MSKNTIYALDFTKLLLIMLSPAYANLLGFRISDHLFETFDFIGNYNNQVLKTKDIEDFKII